MKSFSVPEATPEEKNQEASDDSNVMELSDEEISVPEAEPVPIVVVSPVIKQERRSDISFYTDSSDVVCLGSMVAQEIIINDTEDMDSSLISALLGQNTFPNPFLREIDEGTQPENNDPIISEFNRCSEETFTPHQAHQAHQEAKRKLASKETTNQAASTATGTKPKISVRPCPKSRKRAVNLAPGLVDYIDDDSQSSNGNKSPVDPLQEALNLDFSVFLSTQLIHDDKHMNSDVHEPLSERKTFSFARAAPKKVEVTSDTTCFMAHLHRVNFEKDVKFELHVSLPQFTFYNMIVKDESVKSILNISDKEFISLMNLLNTIVKYDFVLGENRCRTGNIADGFIVRQLDMFFSFEVKFKTFQLHMNGEKFSFVDGSFVSSLNVDLSSSIPPEILNKVKLCK